MEYPKSLLEEQLKKGEDIRGTWPWKLLVFMLFIFASLVVIYLGIVFGYSPYLSSTLKKQDERIKTLGEDINSKALKDLVGVYSRLANARYLLSNHHFPSKIAAFLEENLDSSVYLTNLDFADQSRSLRLEGAASDYAGLARQLEIFRLNPRVDSVTLDSSEEKLQVVQFNIRLILDRELYR